MTAIRTITTTTGKLAAAAVSGSLIALVLTSGTSVGGTPCRGNPSATTISDQTYTGSDARDIIQADDQDNVIYGKGGGDTICSYSGRDTVFGGGGADLLYGENNNDDLIGGRGTDDLRGGRGDRDHCDGGPPTGAGPGGDPDAASACEQVDGVRKGGDAAPAGAGGRRFESP